MRLGPHAEPVESLREENATLVHELNQLRVLKCSMQREVQALSTRLKAIEAGEDDLENGGLRWNFR